jgi:hypothetical protein
MSFVKGVAACALTAAMLAYANLGPLFFGIKDKLPW